MFINTVLYIRQSRHSFQQLSKKNYKRSSSTIPKAPKDSSPKKQSHLQKVNQSYLEHMKNAFSYSMTSFKSGFIFFIHGCFPNVLVDNGSKSIQKLNKQLITKSNKN